MTADTNPTFDCTDISAALSALVDGALREPQRHAAERHLATCASCRALLSDAERNDELLALAAAPGRELPAGFEQAVLARIAGPGAAGTRFRSWLGWIAAAASLGLAGSLWVLDRAGLRSAPAAREVLVAGIGYEPGPELRSSIRPGAPETVIQAPLYRDAPAARVLTSDAADALDSASRLMGMLAAGGATSFASAEQVRRIAEYDDLLPRLAGAREELAAADRAAVLAAESLLYRVVRGPISLGDLDEIRRTSTRLDLPQRLERLGSPGDAGTL
jgi:anti-sigma factor RsiW